MLTFIYIMNKYRAVKCLVKLFLFQILISVSVIPYLNNSWWYVFNHQSENSDLGICSSDVAYLKCGLCFKNSGFYQIFIEYCLAQCTEVCC